MRNTLPTTIGVRELKNQASRVLRATPPSDPAEGEGRMNAFGSTDSFSMRVLSPMILPLERWLLGSMASTDVQGKALTPRFSSPGASSGAAEAEKDRLGGAAQAEREA